MGIFKSFKRHHPTLSPALRASAIAGMAALLLTSAGAATQATFLGSQTQLGGAILSGGGIQATGNYPGKARNAVVLLSIPQVRVVGAQAPSTSRL